MAIQTNAPLEDVLKLQRIIAERGLIAELKEIVLAWEKRSKKYLKGLLKNLLGFLYFTLGGLPKAKSL